MYWSFQKLKNNFEFFPKYASFLHKFETRQKPETRQGKTRTRLWKKTKPGPEPDPDCLTPSRSRTRLFETRYITKVILIWEHEWRQDFNVFPAKVWIFKIFFLVVFAINMLLDNTYGLPNLFEFKSNHFNSFFQAESEFKNSNFGRK